MEIKDIKIINVGEWDQLVSTIYGRRYHFQQQKSCREMGFTKITIPDDSFEDEMNDSIPEIINDEVNMGVKFHVWLDRDPEAILNPSDNELELCDYYHYPRNKQKWCENVDNINLFWDRNFYPCLQAVANDLFYKGLIGSGDYIIEID